MRAVLAVLLVGGAAHAFSGGVTGYSGKDPSKTCNQCHSGGQAPDVMFSGPSALSPGQTATYQIEIKSGVKSQSSGGVDVAASAGTLAATDMKRTKVDSGEIVQSSTGAADDKGVLTYAFEFTAPMDVGKVTLFGDGLSSSGQGTGASASKTVTLDVMVQSNVDLAGVDFTVTQPMPTAHHNDEARWGCDCNAAGARDPSPLAAIALLVLLRRRARNR